MPSQPVLARRSSAEGGGFVVPTAPASSTGEGGAVEGLRAFALCGVDVSAAQLALSSRRGSAGPAWKPANGVQLRRNSVGATSAGAFLRAGAGRAAFATTAHATSASAARQLSRARRSLGGAGREAAQSGPPHGLVDVVLGGLAAGVTRLALTPPGDDLPACGASPTCGLSAPGCGAVSKPRRVSTSESSVTLDVVSVEGVDDVLDFDVGSVLPE